VATAHADPFPFVVSETEVPGATSFAFLNQGPAGSQGFVRVHEGHFHNDEGPVRFWGVNLCFGAAFPKHAEADKMAVQLARLGINAVRFHHLESSYSPNGLYERGGARMDPAQVDKLDYLLAALAKRGISSNLNLHVGRSIARERDWPALGGGSHSASGDKHLLFFMDEIEAAYHEFCREFLGHRNPYRRDLPRAHDPSVAMVEMLNENRFSAQGPDHLLSAQGLYRTAILEKWNRWLLDQYKDDAGIRDAWRDTSSPLGAPLFDSTFWKTGALGEGWTFNDHEKWPATLKFPGDGVLRVAPLKKADAGWNQQLGYEGLSVEKDRPYTLRFEYRADEPRPLSFNVSTLTGGWKSLGLSGSVDAGPEWAQAEFRFTANATVEKEGRLAFDLGGPEAAVELRGVELRPGVVWTVLPENQSLLALNVGLPDDSWVPDARAAFLTFMIDLETGFYQRTLKLLRDELGVRVPIASTQTNYQGAVLNARTSDFGDMHSYWHHPLFPGRQWDMGNWTIGNDPLCESPFENKWPRNSPLMRAGWRVHGRPFTYSEWNMAEPFFYSAGAVPIAATLASLQDWDAVFFFDYDSRSGPAVRDELTSFFTMNGQPCKLSLLPVFGALFRTGALAPLEEIRTAAPGAHRELGVHAFSSRVGIDLNQPEVPLAEVRPGTELVAEHGARLEAPGGRAVWDASDSPRAHLRVDTPNMSAVWGRIGGAEHSLGDWLIRVGEVPENYAVVAVASRDGRAVDTSESMLLVAVNHAENEAMGWNGAKTTVGTQWGHGPTKTWGVPIEIVFPAGTKVLQIHALDGAGRQMEPIVSEQRADGSSVARLVADTLWYELARSR